MWLCYTDFHDNISGHQRSVGDEDIPACEFEKKHRGVHSDDQYCSDWEMHGAARVIA